MYTNSAMNIQNNRTILQNQLGLVVLSAHFLIQAKHDTTFRFEQEAYFFYLTGLSEPGWWVMIDSANNQTWLVAPVVDKTHQVFDGSLAWEEAKRISGIDSVITRTEALELLTRLSKTHETVYTLGPDPHEKNYNFVVNPAPAKMRTMLKKLFVNVADCRQDLTQLRAIKQPHEVVNLKKAATLTVEAFGDVKNMLGTITNEYEIEAELTYAFRKAGAQGHAYEPIVASGKNALTLHYTKNNDKLPKNGLVLIDVGARVNGYCADVTRTYAIGTPTDRHKAVHAAVEKAHHAIIALLGPEKSVKEYHEEVDAIMIEALKSLGLYKKPEDYRKYFPHAISHGLGIDVHDPLGNPAHFKPGMVLTVEPGIYIPEEEIGVRIEDDILITETGIENLTGDLPTSL